VLRTVLRTAGSAEGEECADRRRTTKVIRMTAAISDLLKVSIVARKEIREARRQSVGLKADLDLLKGVATSFSTGSANDSMRELSR
jgi:hypothetical protein